MDWEIPSSEALLEDNITKFAGFASANFGFDRSIEALVINWLHPLMLVSKTAHTNGDHHTWRQAMNGPFDGEYWEAAGIEVETLESMKAWRFVDREVSINFLSST